MQGSPFRSLVCRFKRRLTGFSYLRCYRKLLNIPSVSSDAQASIPHSGWPPWSLNRCCHLLGEKEPGSERENILLKVQIDSFGHRTYWTLEKESFEVVLRSNYIIVISAINPMCDVDVAIVLFYNKKGNKSESC